MALAGFVHSFAEKTVAERTVKEVYGVRTVANDIEVRLGTARTAPEIARGAVHALQADSFGPDSQIKVSVRDGLIGLEGTVDFHYQRSAAEDAVRNIAGVRSLNNPMRVKPRVSPIEVRETIEAGLRRITEVDARRIHIVSHGAKVELHGNVRSWAEREDAQQAVWSAPGVADVVNYLTVTR